MHSLWIDHESALILKLFNQLKNKSVNLLKLILDFYLI